MLPCYWQNLMLGCYVVFMFESRVHTDHMLSIKYLICMIEACADLMCGVDVIDA